MPKSKPFETQYPSIHHFVKDTGWIEIGQNNMISAFVRAYDRGGTVYEGQDTYPASKPHSKTWKPESKPIWTKTEFSRHR